MASAALPDPPLARPVFGDFDGDGVRDAVVVTRRGVLGFALRHAASSRVALLLFLMLLLALGVVVAVNLSGMLDDEAGDYYRY